MPASLLEVPPHRSGVKNLPMAATRAGELEVVVVRPDIPEIGYSVGEPFRNMLQTDGTQREHELYRGSHRVAKELIVPRINDGLLFLDIEGATEEEARTGLAVARDYIARAGVFIEDAMEAAALRDSFIEQELAWEQGRHEHPEPVEFDEDLADIAEEAFSAALNATGATSGRFGLVDSMNSPTRDLFECVA